MLKQIKAAWQRLPVFIRAIVIGYIVLAIGTVVTSVPLLGNLKFHPEIPWVLPATLIMLAVFWAYCSGWGPPISARETRRRLARAVWPSRQV